MPQSNAATLRELNEENANTYNTEMITYFEKEAGYPDHYGGAWLNQNNGHLVIGLTERNEAIEQYYYDVTGADVLEFEIVEYSLQELYDAMVGTFDGLGRYSNLPQANGGAIDQANNSVDIFVSKNDVVKYISQSIVLYIPNNNLKDVMPKDVIVNFKASSDILLESSEAYSGNGFRRGSNSYETPLYGSYGYRAYRYNNGVKEIGFITAGHCIPDIYTNESDRSIYSYEEGASGTYIGVCTFSNAHFGTSVDNSGDYGDVAFIKVANSSNIGNAIYGDSIYTQDLTVQYTIPAQNSTIYKASRKTGNQRGTVIYLYYVDPGNYLMGPYVRRIVSNYISEAGDSGGIVYTKTSGNKARVVGIHQGNKTIDNINRKLVISAYNIHNYCDIISGQ